MKNLVLFGLLLTGALALSKNQAIAQGKTDPWAGSWKFDSAKSQLHAPAPKEETVTSDPTGPDGKTVKYSIHGIAADGSPINESYDGKADGQPYPFIANGQEVAKISYHRDSAHQYSNKGTGADGSTSTGTVTLSQDGKTITIKEHVKSKTGEFDQTVIYHKQ